MPKIIMYSVRPDEEPAIHKWAADNPDFKITIERDALSTETVNLAKGFDGLSVLQTSSVNDPQVYQTLANFGISQMAVRSTGFENYDIKVAKQNNIIVTNVPAYSPRSVAEMTLTQTMALLRHLPKITKQEHLHNFSWKGLESPEIHNLTIGIIGVGKIGYTVARIFKALGATVIGYDILKRPDVQDTLEYVDKETLIKTADVVTLHTPLMESTHHLITAKDFKNMKDSAFLINDARGGLVNTTDLITALKEKQIAAAGLDSIEDESPIFNHDLTGKELNHPDLQELMQMDNVIVTPHTGFYTDMAVQNMVTIALDNVKVILNHQKPFSPVN